MEAADPTLPLYERIKFLAIYSSNLDEFFRVRVASILSLVRANKKEDLSIAFDPETILEKIQNEVERQQEEFGLIFREQLIPELTRHGIHLLLGYPSEPEHVAFIHEYFSTHILPVLHPEILFKRRINHFLRDKALYLVAKLRRKRDDEELTEELMFKQKARYALVQIPTHYFPRFIQLPTLEGKHYIAFLDDIIRHNLFKVFPGFNVEGVYSIKMSRDADLQIEDEFSGNLVSKIKESLVRRQIGAPARFLYDTAMPKTMLKYLKDAFDIRRSEMIAGGKYHNFFDFFAFPNPLKPQLQESTPPQLLYPAIQNSPNIFATLQKQNVLLHFPYHTYDYVLQFLNEAAFDPQVEEIKTTQYRVASDSAIVRALVAAAKNKKKVTVFVEIKARFDEASNIRSAEDMIDAGVNVIYSMPALKVHAKVALVKRREGEKLNAYAFLSTGNFNEKTAKIYADHGFFTSELTYTDELSKLFEYLEKKTEIPRPVFKDLLVAQFNMKSEFIRMIDREIEQARQGKKAYILAKFNNLEEKEMIDKLYEASSEGVKIELILRGICCLKPGIPGLSENIQVTRIVGKYLEHARVYVFYNQGAFDMYLGSADWMDRNLNRRIEVIFPMREQKLKDEVMHVLKLQLTDNVKSVRLNANMENLRISLKPAQPIHAQSDVYKYIASGSLGSATDLYAYPKDM